MSRPSRRPRAGGGRRPTAIRARRPGGDSSRDTTDMTEAEMRSTVSDSSGNPEYGQETEYGTVPVREWVGPGGAGSVTDAWAAGAAADEPPVAEGLPVRGATPAAPRAPEPPPLFRPVSVTVPSDEEVVVQVAEPAAPDGGGDAGADADSVVDLVLDLPSGEEDRGASLGAASASV